MRIYNENVVRQNVKWCVEIINVWNVKIEKQNISKQSKKKQQCEIDHCQWHKKNWKQFILRRQDATLRIELLKCENSKNKKTHQQKKE